ncbi:hypothetical protein Pyn_22212 [Prunus yedoensis var. nudiflora]|uniref:Uncharacterized protein n=1 Tax=Prunus yedoensis var. nudiflora TaxID=2094558 RepID=A0A314ZUI8_PRUYE|nr:hypothetical protein Pyn_22212 [Prunus yedoensis var. nudiflora]
MAGEKGRSMHIPSLARCRLTPQPPGRQVRDGERTFNTPPIHVRLSLHHLISVKKVGRSETEH